ncbi:hypothetical protein [Actinomadura chokoriensis]|uniref:hypothetical protein n=1 Tax=Actinomadura chokoriensis TaxID=454156 RepID=UPI0031F95164
MNTPSIPGDVPGKARNGTGGAAGKAGEAGMAAGAAAGEAAGGVESAGRETAGAAAATAQNGGRAAGQAGGLVTALPGRATAVVRLVTLRRFLRAAPVAAAAVAGVVVGRLTARSRRR